MFRKLFIDLCGGKLVHSIQHPLRENERLFLFFDFTHNMKNIYNIFVNRKIMHPPTTGHKKLLGESCTAKFAHIARLYALEENKSLKIAFDLKKVSLNPSSIARTSPQHALSKCGKTLFYVFNALFFHFISYAFGVFLVLMCN